MENISKVLYPLVNLHIRAWNTTTYFYLYSFDQIFRRLVFVKKETSTINSDCYRIIFHAHVS